MPIKVGILSIFAPFNFVVMLSSQNSGNKGHANIKGFKEFGVPVGVTSLEFHQDLWFEKLALVCTQRWLVIDEFSQRVTDGQTDTVYRAHACALHIGMCSAIKHGTKGQTVNSLTCGRRLRGVYPPSVNDAFPPILPPSFPIKL